MRHGHVDYFGDGERIKSFTQVPLTDLGREQAEEAGTALAHIEFDLAICSGLPRTLQTAQIVLAKQVARRTTISLDVDERLVEIQGGAFNEPMTREALAARMAFTFDQAGDAGASMGEGGEFFADAQVRGVEAVLHALDRPHWKQALILAHEGTNRLLLSWASGAGLKAVRAFEQDLACVNVLDFDMAPNSIGNGAEIVRTMIKSVNLTPYNWTKAGMNHTSIETIFQKI
jgi:probable phosphoglycerate mutase